ncbi:ACRC family protein [Megaselia abdita]
MNSSNSSHSTKSERKPLNPLLLTSSSDNVITKTTDSEETFCSKFEETRKCSTDLFSEAPSSNLNDLIKILSNKVNTVCLDEHKENNVEFDKSEIVSTEYQRPSDLFSSPGFAQNIKSDEDDSDDEVISLSSDSDGENEESDSDEVIEVSSSSTDEYGKVEARINFMTSSVESRASSARSTLGRKSRMERFLKDVSRNLKTLNLEDDFKVKKKISDNPDFDKDDSMNEGSLSDTQSMANFTESHDLKPKIDKIIVYNDTESMSNFSGHLADTESVPEFKSKTPCLADLKNDIMLKETEYMTGFTSNTAKKLPDILSDTQSMAGFNLYDTKKSPVDTNLANKNDSTIKDESAQEGSLQDTESMTQFSFVSTRSRKKYDKPKNYLPETESMTNFSAFSHSGSISPRSIKNNQDISLTNFTISDKLSSSLRDQSLFQAPVVDADSFSINGSLHRSHYSNSSKISNSLIPEESLTISETSSDNDEKCSIHSPTEKNATNKTDKSESNEEQISITAKFNIKIQLSGIITDSVKEMHVSEKKVTDTEKTPKKINSEQKNTSLECKNVSGKALIQENNSSPDVSLQKLPKTPPIVVTQHDNKSDFDDSEFESNVKLLTKLYGNEWKTPGVKEILISQSTKKKKPKPKNVQDVQGTPIAPQHNQSIGDFSHFYSHVSDDLDSTRLTPNGIHKKPNHRQILRPQFTRMINYKVPTPKELYPQLKDDSDSSSEDIPKRTKRGRIVKKTNFVFSCSEGSESEDKYDSDDSFLVKTSGSEDESPRKLSKNKKDKIIYLDLTKQEIEEVTLESCESPGANRSEEFNERLKDLLNSCKITEKKKMEATPVKKPKRKLFTKRYSYDEEEEENKPTKPIGIKDNKCSAEEEVKLRCPLPEIFNKQLYNIKPDKKIEYFEPRSLDSLLHIYTHKHTFLKSLDGCVSKSVAHPDAIYYRDSFKTRKEELCLKLNELYNKKVFNGELQVPITWNKKLLTTAGRCMTTKKAGVRSSRIEMSDKVCTSADRLRCTLIHELCHAATWNFSEEGGHGATWKNWAKKANKAFPELPFISVCHDYDIEYKYTYKCTLCAAKSHAHSKSKKVENIRCSFCLGAVEIFLNKKDKQGNVIPTPVKSPKGFSKFVKVQYKQFKTNDLKHAEVMKLLSNAYAALDVNEKKNY